MRGSPIPTRISASFVWMSTGSDRGPSCPDRGRGCPLGRSLLPMRSPSGSMGSPSAPLWSPTVLASARACDRGCSRKGPKKRSKKCSVDRPSAFVLAPVGVRFAHRGARRPPGARSRDMEALILLALAIASFRVQRQEQRLFGRPELRRFHRRACVRRLHGGRGRRWHLPTAATCSGVSPTIRGPSSN